MNKFNSHRYVTRGVYNSIPVEVQILLWQAIDKIVASETDVDYLQVFKLESKVVEDKNQLIITHTQEVPKYKEVYEIC